MLNDARNLEAGSVLKYDICVVGAGHAGISLVQELDNAGVKVVLLESGGFRREEATQDLYKGRSLNIRHAPPHRYRERIFGGTSTVWGGRCAPYDDIDMEPRPYIPHSDWPISRKELDPFYERAYELCDIGRYTSKIGDLLPGAQEEMVPGLASPHIATDRVWLFSRPTDFGKKFRRRLIKSGNIHVYLHANCIGIQANRKGTSIDHLRVSSLENNQFRVYARYFVLCTGALETTRLLLASSDVFEKGIGNTHGNVGRYYVSHITGKIGPVKFSPKRRMVWGYERTVDNIYCRRAFRISDSTQKERGLPNFRAIIDIPPPSDPSHGSAVVSAMYLFKRFFVRHVPPEYAADLSGLGPCRKIVPHLTNLIRGFPSLATFSINWMFKRVLSRRKLPSAIIENKSQHYYLHFDAEQIPNPESRILLGEERDVFGIPKIVVDYRYMARDIEGAVACCKLLVEELERTGTGKSMLDDKMLAAHIEKYTGVGSHNYGTTRMAKDAAHGVVDGDCRVFGINNLYIASSSVLPTTSFANPALTICALAVRVARHLMDKERQRTSDVEANRDESKGIADELPEAGRKISTCNRPTTGITGLEDG